MRSVVLIPSRLDSSRLPGKALLEIGGIPMIVRVMTQASMCANVEDVYVCTDSVEIADVIRRHDGKVVMTSSNHMNGTTRIAEAKSSLPHYDFYIDVQGDEPFINPEHISAVIGCYESSEADIILPLLPFTESSPSNVKVVKDLCGRVLYMSRAEIPFQYGAKSLFNKHLSIIGFNPDALDSYANFPASPLELIEGIELLRALEHGMHIQTIELSGDSFSIDTAQDYNRAQKRVSAPEN